jgi:preprotein translocase subunit SecA
MDVNKLLKALDDESNESLLNFTTKKIKEMNFNILKELALTNAETLELLKKLDGYKYVDEMNELKYGTYLRWISIKDPNNIYLTKGALFCEVNITDNGVNIVCKNMGVGCKHFQIKMDETLIFQKLTQQELVILNALDHLSK